MKVFRSLWNGFPRTLRYQSFLSSVPGYLFVGLWPLLLSIPQLAIAGSLASSSDSRCNYEYSGPVTAGDLARFEPLGGGPSEWPVICLDSPGGSLVEAAKIFRHIWQQNIGTAVLPGNRCLSACGLIFLGGSYATGSDVTYQFDRTLWAGGQLGFHSPRLELPPGENYNDEQVSSAFEGALSAARLIYEINQTVDRGNRAMSDFLYYQILSTPPSKMKYIETIGDAVLSDIGIKWQNDLRQTINPGNLADAEIDFLCQNYLARTELKESFSEPTTDLNEVYRNLTENISGSMGQSVRRAISDGIHRFIAGPYFASTKFFDYYCAIESEQTSEGSVFQVALYESDSEPDIGSLPDASWYEKSPGQYEPYYRFDPQVRIENASLATTKNNKQSKRFVTFSNRDIDGMDIAMKKQVTADQCVAFCSEFPDCDTVVFNRWNNLCFAKDYDGSLPASYSAPSDIMTRNIQVKSEIIDNSLLYFVQRKGRKFTGSPLLELDNTTTDHCERTCGSIDQCSAFNFDGANCSLYATTQTHIAAKRRSIIGYKVQK